MFQRTNYQITVAKFLKIYWLDVPLAYPKFCTSRHRQGPSYLMRALNLRAYASKDVN